MLRYTEFLALIVAGGVLIGCENDQTTPPSEPGSLSPSARTDTVALLLDDLHAPRHPSDGGGRAWLAGEIGHIAAGGSGRYRIVYEAGPEGIAVGGSIYLLPSPFWGWSGAHAQSERKPGYTVVTTSAPDIELDTFSPDGQILVITIGGRALQAGDQVELAYGAGVHGATVDSYAERASLLWLAVDGDGDGVRSFLFDSPAVSVAARAAARMVVTLPSVARPREAMDLTVALLDDVGNAGLDYRGEISFTATPSTAEVPLSITMEPSDHGIVATDWALTEPGTFRLHATSEDGISATSNPVIVTRDGAEIFWGDLHGHSAFSDGSATPEDYLTYARDVAALDVVALTDHDHWGVVFLDQTPPLWSEIRKQIKRFNQPGTFVALLGFEWTSWLHGHRHVLYFEDDGPILSSLDPVTDTPSELWAALYGRKALTVAHHSAGGPIATNWTYAPDPEFETVTEVVSVHGSSEAADSPHPIYGAIENNWVRDAIDRGFILGFIGSGDSHDGHPGLAHIAGGSGGVAAILADDLTREGVLAAIKNRRVYATNGPRIVLRFAVGGHPMGSIMAPSQTAEQVYISISGTAPIDRVDLVRSGRIVSSFPGNDRLDVQFTVEIDELASGEYIYARAVQQDGGTAWSSPVFVREPDTLDGS